MKIFKYEIPICDKFQLELPEGAKIIEINTQFEIPFFWAIIDENAPLKKRFFSVVGTGEPFNPDETWEYIGTAHINEKPAMNIVAPVFVWHLFEIKKLEW